jgi:hypothetical protein
MLRRIRLALGDFERRSGTTALPPDDPLAQIGASWPQLVGEEVARSSRPSELRGGTLGIVTRSSAWSQQLSFLSTQILAGLAQLPAGKGVIRLRFRVGRMLPQRSASVPAPAMYQARLSSPALEPAPSLAAAFERWREHVADRQRVLRERNANLCSQCQAEISGGRLCAPCASAARRNRIDLVQRLMYDSPWLGFAKIHDLVDDLSADEYTAARNELLERWWQRLSRAAYAGKISADRREAKIADAYVMLQSGLLPERVTTAVVRNLLGSSVYSLIYGADNN